MEIRLPGGVDRLIVLEYSGTGGLPRPIVYEEKRKKRKTSKAFRAIEKQVRRSARGQRAFADEFLDRHERSSGKKKNGWLKDLGKNIFRASKKGLRKVR